MSALEPVREAAALAAANDPELRALLEQVSAVRGLAGPPALELVTLPAHELARAALAQADQSWPEPARRAQALLLWRLGLLPAAADPLALLAPAFASQLEAFYARVRGVPTLFVHGALGGGARRRALAHELVHALQDHEHALLQRLADDAQSSDRRSALHALAEADALAVVERLGLAEATAQAPYDVSGIPPVLLRSLAAPYLDARELVADALRAGGFAAVDHWLRSPPPSTQALLRAGGAAEVAAPLPELAPPGAEWQRRSGDVLGEQSLRLVLEEGEPARAQELAAAWRADRLSIFENGEQSVLAWQLELASEAAAADIEPLLQRGMAPATSNPGSRAGLPGAEWTCGAHSDSGVVATARSQRQVVFASLIRPAQIVSLAAQCATLQSWIAGTRLVLRPG